MEWFTDLYSEQRPQRTKTREKERTEGTHEAVNGFKENDSSLVYTDKAINIELAKES